MEAIDFSPAKAVETLRENSMLIGELGDTIDDTYREVILLRAKYMDCEGNALEKYFCDPTLEIKVSEMRDWIKHQCHDARKELELKELELKRLRQKYDVVVEVMNATKAAFKIQSDSTHTTNY